MLELFARAFNLGLVATIMPGPLQTIAINSALAHGWRRSVLIGFAPLLSDIPIILVVLFLLRQFPPEFLSLTRVVGGGFLLYIAYGAYQVYRQRLTLGGDGAATQAVSGMLLRRAVLSNLVSPGPYLFWGTIHGPAVLDAAEAQGWGVALAYIAIFYIVFFVGITLIILAFDRARSLNPRIVRGILLLTIIGLAFFGISLLWQGVGEVL
jgi:threonine/homoserine/homoserine lactone efflux protein